MGIDYMMPVPPKPFIYSKENVYGVLPYIRKNGLFGVAHWMMVFTSAAVYFVDCGLDNSLLPGAKAKKLEEETKNKGLEELLKYGSDFYRVSAEQLPKLNYKKGWFSNSVSFVNSEKRKVVLNLKNLQYAKFLEMLPLVKPSGIPQGLIPATEITKETLGAGLLPLLTEEEQKQERRRRKALGWVLLINSLISLGAIFWLGSKGSIDDSLAAGILPAIVDIGIAIALFTSGTTLKNGILSWVFGRAVLGLVIWGGLQIPKQDWVALVMQVSYFTYLIYHSKVKATAKTFKVAMYLLALAVVILVGGTFLIYQQSKQSITQYDSKLTAQGEPINTDFSKQLDLVFYKKGEAETNADDVRRRKEILRISYEQKTQLANIMPLLDEGLKKFPDAGSQKNLSGLKTLYQLESTQNQAVIDFYEYVDGLDLANVTPDQQTIYDQKEQAMRDAYTAVGEQGKKMQNDTLSH